MAAPVKKSVKQDDLRRLMKERRNLGSSESIKIDSPLAKYDNLGNLSCSVCKLPIKNQAHWSTHLVSRIHKTNLENLKKTKQDPSSGKLTFAAPKRPHENGLKGEVSPSEKKSKTGPEQHSKVLPIASQHILGGGYSSSEESDQESDRKATTPPVVSQLPLGFFDERPSESSSKRKTKDQVDNNTSIPEGFFDDPILDAKVRKVEYKDPMDEEWEKFQKTITEETHVSQAIIEEDLEESKLEREIDEIDEQINNWSRVEALLERKDTITAKDAQERESGGSSADEQDYQELLDWRAKGAWGKS